MKAYPMGLSKAVDTAPRLDFGGPSFGRDGYAFGDCRRDCRVGARLSLRREPSCPTAQPHCPLGLRTGIPRGDRQSGALFSPHRATHSGTLSARRARGIPRPTWTAPLLAKYLAEKTGIAVGEWTVRHHLALLDYVCRRPTWTVRHKAEEQPDYAPKKTGTQRPTAL